MIRFISILVVFIISPVMANNWWDDDLRDDYNDQQFKKVFSDNDVPACIWLVEYRKNQVLDGEMSREEDAYMKGKCSEANYNIAHFTKRTSTSVVLGPNGENFTPSLRKRYKENFPNWKSNMKKILNDSKAYGKEQYNCYDRDRSIARDCYETSQERNKNESTSSSKNSGLTGTIGNTANSLKNLTGIFGKE